MSCTAFDVPDRGPDRHGLQEAKQAAESGAHALLLKARLFQAQSKLDHEPDEVVRELMYQLSGDD